MSVRTFWSISAGLVVGLMVLVALLLEVTHSQDLKNRLVPKRVIGLNYPRLVHLTGVQGKVELVAIVSEQGTVKSVRYVSGDGGLAHAASDALSRWVYSPCKQASDECEVKVFFNFVLDGECEISNCPSEFQIDLPDLVTVKSKFPHAILN